MKYSVLLIYSLQFVESVQSVQFVQALISFCFLRNSYGAH